MCDEDGTSLLGQPMMMSVGLYEIRLALMQHLAL